MNENIQKFRQKNLALAAISADSPEKLKKYAEENEIDFPLLSDSDLEVIKDYGVLMKDSQIAVPSLFIIDQKGSIQWRYIGDSMTDRPEVEEVVKKAEKWK